MKQSYRVVSVLVLSLFSACAEPTPESEQRESADGSATGLSGQTSALQARHDWTRESSSPAGFHALGVDSQLVSVTYAAADALETSWSFGERWHQPLEPRGAQAGLSSIVIDPNRAGAAYAVASDKLFATDNAGITWSASPATHPLLAVAPGNSDVMWARHDASSGWPFFYRSADRGTTWTELDFGGPGSCCGDFVAVSERVIYATGYIAQLQRSSDGGATWDFTTFADLYLVSTFDVDRRNPALVYAGTFLEYGGVEKMGFRKSSDGGKTWTRPSAQLAAAEVSRIAVSPVDGRVYVAARTTSTDPIKIYVSRNGGQTFTSSTDGFSGAYVTRIIPHPKLPCVAYVVADGIYRTLNAGGTCQLPILKVGQAS